MPEDDDRKARDVLFKRDGLWWSQCYGFAAIECSLFVDKGA